MAKKQTRLSKSEVEHIAKLANLQLSTEEVEKFRGQLSEILNYINKLQEVDTQGVAPTNQVTGLENVTRKDRIDVNRTLSVKKALSQARQTHNQLFVAKNVFDEA